MCVNECKTHLQVSYIRQRKEEEAQCNEVQWPESLKGMANTNKSQQVKLKYRLTLSCSLLTPHLPALNLQ